MVQKFVTLLGAITLALTLGACSSSSAPSGQAISPTPRTAEVHLSPTCTCCTEHVAYLRRNGWTVEVVEEADMAAFQSDRGIPESARGCHTTLVGGYVVDGHVPLAAIDRLLAEQPEIDGIALPGMPAGSPGMSGTADGAFLVVAFDEDEVTPFGEF